MNHTPERISTTMFTGIISAVQPIVQIDDAGEIRRCTIQLPHDWKLSVGESINVDGVCSTVVAVGSAQFTVEYIPETLRVTTLKQKAQNDVVNLERSLRLNDLVSGHLVTGHVDTTGIVEAIHEEGESRILMIVHPAINARFLISKGSIAVNGVSLTVIDPEGDHFSVAIIPHTLEQTNIGQCHVGSVVNLEYDMLAKYVAQQISHGST